MYSSDLAYIRDGQNNEASLYNNNCSVQVNRTIIIVKTANFKIGQLKDILL